ncbi:CynX/NimT family MFS transporter [Jeotgalibacillus salarius]|uniref:MFS transporter n=1 Tax=Jeotgalibacillus salarius TaxID=546023 RepID=A0A4Y8LLP5_9BACL|nr:MFS transporter [Jeotgalibacillus salarius]TFE01645.1 MFS transporter [Jeotgalibacillus salarius]
MKIWYLIIALFLVSINLRPAITSVAPLLETIQQDLGMSGTTAGLLTTLPVLCMGIFAPLATKISERVGLERGIFYSLMLITFATALRGFFGTVPLLIVTAFLAGVGIGIAGPLVSGFIKQYFPTKPGVVGVYTVSMAIGAGSATGISAPVYEAVGSWKPALAIWAILGVAAMFVWIRFPGKKKAEILSEKTALPWTSGRAWLILIFFGLMSSIFYSVTAWGAPIIQSMGYGSVAAGSMLTAFVLIQIPSSFIIPSLVAKYGYVFPTLIGCTIVELGGILLLISGGHPLLAMLLIGLGAGGLFPLALMLPIIETNTYQQASAWAAMSQGGGYVISAMGPMGVGAVYDYTGSYTAALYGMVTIIVIMGVIQILLWTTARQTTLKR